MREGERGRDVLFSIENQTILDTHGVVHVLADSNYEMQLFRQGMSSVGAPRSHFPAAKSQVRRPPSHQHKVQGQYITFPFV